ncbi:MAG: ferritin-like domain-containing protein [Pseudonocardiaceae bacterium]
MTEEQPQEQAVNRILARNLTAEAAYNVPGNPPSTRPESGVANCYPGLEYDQRTLDRRFLPGLVVAYVSQADTSPASLARQGARVVDVDLSDNALVRPDPAYAQLARELRTQLSNLAGQLTPDQPWFISAVEQAGTRIEFVDDQGVNLDGMVAWRLVRGLRPGPVTVVVTQRIPPTSDQGPQQPPSLQLTGWRRSYTDPRTGVIDTTYQPGELTQSLCSPWTHDFRDCSCTYWASNHPDIVFPSLPPGQPTQPSGLPTDPSDENLINWQRDPSFAELHAQPLPSQGANRPFEISYYQINEQWQDLSVVLEGREAAGLYIPRSAARDEAVPFATAEELWKRIEELAGLEHLVALLYLYALFSVIDPAEAQQRQQGGLWPTLADDVAFTRSVLLEIATSEMQHLRWANHLLWGLAEATNRPYEPAIVPPARVLPAAHGGAPRPAELAALTADTLALFVDIEQSSAFIDGQYARVTATLRQPGYPQHLYQLASNIAAEGEEHYLHFRDLQHVLGPYGPQQPVYLRSVSLADPAQPEVAEALAVYQRITDLLVTGYRFGDKQNGRALAEARALMFDLQDRAEQLAEQGHGIPFLAGCQ